MSGTWVVSAVGTALLLAACSEGGGGTESDAGQKDAGPDSAVLHCQDDDRDEDGDGFGPCIDCDDHEADVSPAVNEGYCCSTNLDDGVDNDCDGEIDETPLLAGCSCYEDDQDGDGYLDWFDCEPEDTTINPGIVEGQYCSADRDDDKDNDCDGDTDENDEAHPCDADFDGSPEADDCDDLNSWVNPLYTESCCRCTPGDYRDQQCDGLDNDCDGETDESPVCDCNQPDRDYDGFRAGDDCDDNDSSVYPSMVECCCEEVGSWWCNGRDDDCDGEIDEQQGDCCTRWYGGED